MPVKYRHTIYPAPPWMYRRTFGAGPGPGGHYGESDGWKTETMKWTRKSENPNRSEITSALTYEANGLKYFNECFHTTQETEYRGMHYRWNMDWDAYRRLNPGGGIWGAFSEEQVNSPAPTALLTESTCPDPYRILPSLDWRSAYESLLNDASGLMPDDISVGVNILEFASLKRLVPSLAKSIQRMLSWAKGHPNKKIRKWVYLKDKQGKSIPWTGDFQTVEARSLKWCLRDLAGTHLGVSFGVLPFAEDFANWVAKYWQVKTHLRWYNQLTDGHWHKIRAKTPTVVGESSSSGTYRVDSQLSYKYEDRSSWSAYGVLGCKARVKPKSYEDRVAAITRQIIGYNVPLQLAWDLVPFSFVVDWFLPIGKLIQRIEPKRAIGGLAQRIECIDFWHSTKMSAEGSREVTECVPVNSAWRTREMSQGGKVTKRYRHYERLRGLPAMNWLPSGNIHYGARQVMLSLSLGTQRMSR